MNDPQALLVVERGPVPSLRFQLQQDQVILGRSAGSDLVLADPEVSRRHARFVRRADGFAVEDMGSTNGTFVNGQRVSHLTRLQDGDTIDLGDTVRLRFVALGGAARQGDAGAYTRPVVEPEPEPLPVAPAVTWPEPVYEEQVFSAAAAGMAAGDAYAGIPDLYEEERRRPSWLLLGCGLLVALLLVCAGTFLVLDAYQQGRLLYCGPLASVFETILGPLGFAPLCP